MTVTTDTVPPLPPRSTRKRDRAPRGVFRHESGAWAVRFTCGAGHIHEERVSTVKSDAVRVHAARRQRAHDDPFWCPKVERRQARERAQEKEQSERRRVTFRSYAEDYLAWSAVVHRAQRTAKYEVHRLVSLVGDALLDAITPADVEGCLRVLGETLAPASVNRLRDRLSGMFRRAKRLGRVTVNPVSEIPKLKEAGQRLAFLSQAGEAAILSALPAARRPLVVIAVNSGLRWSERRRSGGRTWTY
jgi:hypothetical protein